MKIKNIKDPKGFFEKLKECKGTLEIVTPQGDRLNLKSKLSQYIIMSDIFSDATIGDLELIASEPDDLALILAYLIKS